MKPNMKNEVQEKIGQVKKVQPHPETFIRRRYQYETPFGEVYVVRFGEVVRVACHATACP